MTWHVLREPDFRRYFSGSVCSNLGTWLQNTAQILLAYRLTDSVWWVGMVTFAQFCSPLVLGPVAGLVAERADRRLILIVTQTLSAFCAAFLAVSYFTGMLTKDNPTAPYLLVLGALGIGLNYTFALPAMTTFVPTLVKPENARAALAMNTVCFHIGRALAPVLGIVVVIFIGFGWAFVINALSFLVLVAALRGIVPSPRPSRLQANARVMDGVRYSLRNKKIAKLLLVVAAATAATDPVMVLGPAIAREITGTDTSAGYFISALGTGTVLGALLTVRNRNAHWAGLYLGGLGVSIVVFAIAPSIWVAVPALLVAGLTGLLTGAATQTLLRDAAGPMMENQVMAVWAIAFAGSRPITSVIDGWLAGLVGLRWAAIIVVLPALIAGGLALRKIPAADLVKAGSDQRATLLRRSSKARHIFSRHQADTYAELAAVSEAAGEDVMALIQRHRAEALHRELGVRAK